MKRSVLAFLLALSATSNAWAGDADIDLDAIANRQSYFKDLSREVGLAIAYKPTAPAEPLGVLGFDFGLEVTAADIDDDKPYWQLTTDDVPGMLPVPKLHARVGLPFNLDVGGIYSKIPGSDISLVGASLKWAIIEGGAVTPAVAVRGAYTRLNGIDDLDLNTRSIDISISKGFAFLTPYAGVGSVKIESDPTKAALGLKKEDISETVSFVGLQISMAILKLTVEAEFAEIPSYTLKLSMGI